MAVLIGMSADVKGKNFTIDGEELTIGRSNDNAIPINNPTVSGHHCKVVRDGDRFILRDLGSTNGTRVNTKDVKEAVLKPKDILQVGSVEFMFNDENAAVPMEEESAFASTEEVVSQGDAVAPKSFSSISPFGARRREQTGLWTIILWVLGAIAIAGVAYLGYTLATLQ